MTEEEKRALLEGVRGEVFERALSEAQHGREAAMLRRERDEARAQLAAVTEAVREVLDEPHAYIGGRERSVLTCALGAAAATAEAYTRRVALAGECRGMRLAADMCCSADDIGDGGGAISAALEQVADRLSARADEIEGGR